MIVKQQAALGHRPCRVASAQPPVSLYDNICIVSYGTCCPYGVQIRDAWKTWAMPHGLRLTGLAAQAEL